MSRETHQPNLILVGFMGTGKSTVGPIVAQMMGRPFVDTDMLIEQEAGLSVSEIFALRGEAAFRVLESAACCKVANRDGLVVAIGGGALLDPRNLEILQGTGVLVLLSCETGVLVQRLTASAARGERPLLAGDVGERVTRLLNEREHIYAPIMLRIDTTSRTPLQVAETVLTLYQDATRAEIEVGAK